ncbi:hypothetical protein ACT2CV_01200 [Pasteurellaceae bacterium 22721_9_1]
MIEMETAERNKRDLAEIDKELAEVERKVNLLHEERREYINRHNLNKENK